MKAKIWGHIVDKWRRMTTTIAWVSMWRWWEPCQRVTSSNCAGVRGRGDWGEPWPPLPPPPVGRFPMIDLHLLVLEWLESDRPDHVCGRLFFHLTMIPYTVVLYVSWIIVGLPLYNGFFWPEKLHAKSVKIQNVWVWISEVIYRFIKILT